MKKIDLHVSLEGSINIAHANNLMSVETRNVLIKKDAEDLESYLRGYELAIRLMQKRENLLEFTKLLIEDLVNDDIVYAEIHFCPLRFTTLMSVDEVMQTIIEGIDNPNIKIKLVLEMQREYTLTKNLSIVKIAKTYADYVGGLSLVGDEQLYKTATFRQLFEIIKIDNIPFSIEAISPESVLLAAEFGARRIVNGVNAITNEEVLNCISMANTYVELAPTCNIDSKICDGMEGYPIELIRSHGVKSYISVPNRTTSNTTLTDEYKLLKDNYKYLNKDLLEYILNGVDAAFIRTSEKAELKFLMQKNKV